MPLSDAQYLQINQALFSLAHAYESRRAKDEQRTHTGLALSDRAVLMVLGQFAAGGAWIVVDFFTGQTGNRIPMV